MVKKIKLIEEQPDIDELEEKDYQAKMLEYMQAIDWKLWEMLKLYQAWADREGITENKAVEVPAVSVKPRTKTNIKPIIVDEE